MQIYIQDRSESTVATIGDFYEDMHKTLTSTGTGSYEFTVSKSEPGQEFLNVGNYVVLLDEQNKGHQFTITKVDQLHDEKTVYAEDASLQLLSKEARPWAKLAKAQPASYYFNKALKGTGWVIGVNQIAKLTRTLEWTGWDTVLTRLLSIATEFDNAELDFHVELDRTNVVRKVVDIYKQVGAYRDDIQLVYGDTANDIQKTESTENFATAIEGIGSLVENTKEGEPEKHYNFSAIGYDDGDLYSPKGDPKLYSRKAHEKWDGKYGYSERHFEYETKDPQELLNRSKTELKKRCEPEVNYEISIADGRLIDINKGDTVKIFDHTYNPELLLQARAVEVDKSYTDPSQNKAIFGNFLTLISNADPRILAIQKQISQLPKARTPYPWVRYADDDKGTGMSMFPAGKAYMATVWNYETAVPSDNPIDYAGKWIKVKGEDGQDGSNGVPGPKGEDGQTSYFHTAWADDISGSIGFTTSGGDGKKYIGTYSDLTKADSEDHSKYNWALFKGEKGDVGPKGDSGDRGLQGLQGPQGSQGIQGPKGPDGKSSYTHIAYATSSTGSGFTQTPTATTTYVGMYVDQTATDSADPNKYAWSLIKGEDGSNGTPGKPGADGKTPYLHTAYSWSADGTDRFMTVYPRENLWSDTKAVPSYVSAGDGLPHNSVPPDAAMIDPVTVPSTATKLVLTIYNPNKLVSTSRSKPSFFKGDTYLGVQSNFSLTGDMVQKEEWSIPAGATKAYLNTALGAEKAENFDFSIKTKYEFNIATPYTPSPLDDPEGAYPKFIGTYTDYIADDSTDPSKYTWAKLRGEQGPKGDAGKDGVDGKDGEPGSKDVPVTTVSAAQPTTAKNGDIWWVLNSADVATAMKVYTSGAWVDKKVDQSVLNIVTLNAVTINGSTINGSEFNISYTGTLVDGLQGSSQQTLDKYGYSQTSTIPWFGGPIVTRSEIDNTGGIVMGWSNQSKYNPSKPWDNIEGKIYLDPINLRIGFVPTGLSGNYFLDFQDAYQNSGSATYLNGWGSWNADYSLKVVRRGRMVTVWGYIKHNNSATITPFAQVPAWARPEQGILISAVTFDSKVHNPMASTLVMNAETGKIGFNSGGQKGGYVCFSTTYVGGYIVS